MSGENVEVEDFEDVTRASKGKRRKVARSCEFCRRRKLKCDQMRPQCSTCRSRGLNICRYNTDNPNLLVLRKPTVITNDITTAGTKRSTNGDITKTKTTNKPRVDDPSAGNIPPPSFKHKNIYKNNHYLQTNPDGSRLIYGPTSLRQLVFKRYPVFLNQVEITPPMTDHPIQYLHHNPHEIRNNPNSKSNHGFFVGAQFNMNAILNDLPSFDSLLSMINKFFHIFNKGLYPVCSIFDEQKVLNDFYSIFIPNNKVTFNNGERPILHILVNEDIHCVNNYRLGVLLLIVVITSCLDTLPKSMHDFFTILNGTVSMKCMFTERLQFLLLLYYTKSLQPSIENTHGNDDYYAELVNISDRLITGALSMGLHYDVKELYRDQANVVGNLDNLNNLRLWIVLIDFEIALRMGRPLMIRNTTILNEKDDKEVNDIIVDEDGLTTYMTNGDKQETIFLNKLKRFLRMARPIITNIHEDDEIDLRSHIECIINFISTEFGNLEYFIDMKQIRQKKSFKEYILVSKALQLVIILLTLANEFRSKEMISQSKHEVLPQILLFSLRFMKLLMQRALKVDKERFPELVEWQGNMSPYLISTLFVVNNLLPSVLTVFHMFLYGKVSKINRTNNYSINKNVVKDETSKEGEYIMFSDLYDILGIHCDPLDMTVMKFLDSYRQIIDEWWGDNNYSLRRYLTKNKTFSNLILLELKLKSIVEPLVNLSMPYHKTADVINNDQTNTTSVDEAKIAHQANNDQNVGQLLESEEKQPIYVKPPKPIKTTQEALKMYNSFSIGRSVNSVKHGVTPSMFQEFQVTQSDMPITTSNMINPINKVSEINDIHNNNANTTYKNTENTDLSNPTDFHQFNAQQVDKGLESHNHVDYYWNSNYD